MAKFYGPVGYAVTVEGARGVKREEIEEHMYSGDLLRNIRRLQSSDKVTDDIGVANKISIIADPFALQNFHKIRYAGYMGTKWKVTEVEPEYPRLTLTLGGIYHGT